MNDGRTNIMTSGGGQNINPDEQPGLQMEKFATPNVEAQQPVMDTGFVAPVDNIPPVGSMPPMPAPGVDLTQPYYIGTQILTPSGLKLQKKSPNKWLIIAIIAAILSLGLAIASVIFANRPRNIDNTGTQDVISADADLAQYDAYELFNIYANLLLYGKNSKGTIDGFPGLSYMYTIDGMELEAADDQEQIDQRLDYYEALLSRLNLFYDKVSELELSDEDMRIIYDYLETASSYLLASQSAQLSGGNIAEYYLEHGYDDILNFIYEYYSPLTNSLYADAINLGDALINLALLHLDEFIYHESVGCIDGSAVAYECALNSSYPQNYDITESEEAVESIIEYLRDSTISGVWEVYEQIN